MVGVSARIAKLRLIVGSGVAAASFLMIAVAPIAGAQQVQAMICRMPAVVTITQPANDSVLTEGAVQLTGAVRQANQLEVYVDGVLDSIVPVGLSDTTYGASVQLSEGTHVIKIVAIDACQIGNGEASAVVTYQPAVTTPSSGEKIPTTVDGAPGVRVGEPVQQPAASIGGIPSFVAQPLQRLGDVLDLGPQTGAPASRETLPQVARFGMLTTGALVVIFSQTISAAGASGHVLQFAAQRIGLMHAAGSRILTVVLGGVFIALAFLL